MNPLVQSYSYWPKDHGRDKCVGLLVISHQTREWETTIALFGFKLQQQPWGSVYNKKQKSI